jgi:hypothetical protein
VTADPDGLDDARQQLGLSHYDLWLRYVGIGGTRDAFAVRSYLTGSVAFDDVAHDHLVVALNEAFADAGDGGPLPYHLA